MGGFRKGKHLALTGINLAEKSPDAVHDLFMEILDSGMHGLCFSAYEEGQGPGAILSRAQIERRMKILASCTQWVRSFSCIEGNELVPKVAKDCGLKTMVGAWLGDDRSKNEREIEGLLKLAEEGSVDIAAVGNEVLYRKDLTLDELLGYMHRVKAAIPGIPIGYVDAYYEFTDHPELVEASDVILANCYPFWEGCHIDYSLVYMQQMYYQALAAGRGKKVIITETGWPSAGTALKASQPSMNNALRYFLNAQLWSNEADIDMFYFTSFDEGWKVGAEGDVGAFWGIWDKGGELKYNEPALT
jgi:exo-beta-1,3-glucanase (GH17 family)